MNKCTNINQLYALRFLIGLAQSGYYPGMLYIIGSWYRGDELAKRSSIFHATGFIGTMVSGYLMAGVYHLDGMSGFKAWQWLFIVDTVISLPISVAGFFLLPDLPEITTAWWLSKDEVIIAQKRMQLEHRANRAPYTWAKIKKILCSWRIHSLSLLLTFFINGMGALLQPGFSIWLRNQGYDITEINSYPSLTFAVTIIAALIAGWTSDTVFRGARWPAVVISGVFSMIMLTSLAVWDIPNGWKWACFVLLGWGLGNGGLIFAWAHEICSDDNEERAIVTASMAQMAFAFQAFLPLIIWQQVDAPEYKKGYLSSVFLTVGMIVTALIIRVLQRREVANKGKVVEGQKPE